MKIAFITNVPDSIGRIKLAEEAARRGHSFELIKWKNTSLKSGFAKEIADTLKEYDVVHFAGGLGNFATREVQNVLEVAGVFCPNSYTRRSFNVDHKVYQAIKFVEAELPFPPSVRATSPDISVLEKEIGWPMVAKKPDSSQGKGVMLIRSEAEMDKLKPKKEYLFQKYIDYVGDYRVHIVDGLAFCPYRRIPGQEEFRANVSLGGTMEKVEAGQLLNDICELGKTAAEAMNLEFCAVDMVLDKQSQLFLLETNSDPGFKDVEEVTGESFTAPIMDYYERRVNEIRSS